MFTLQPAFQTSIAGGGGGGSGVKTIVEVTVNSKVEKSEEFFVNEV